MNTAVGIFGASGYSGIELSRILSRHPGVRLSFVTSDRWAGRTVRSMIPDVDLPLTYVSPSDVATLAGQCEVALLATPADVSLKLGEQLLSLGRKVIDLSGAFRLDDPAAFERSYGMASSGSQKEAVYALPEFSREGIADAKLVSNPGCYPTAAALGLAPLLRAGLLDPSSLIIDAASGVTGAGRKATEAFSFTEIAGDFRAYRVLKHQHTPEITQVLGRAAGEAVKVVFTPHLLPLKRGILSTAYARLRADRKATSEELREELVAAYRDEPFVQVAAGPDEVSLHQVVGTNLCRIGVAAEPEAGGQVVVISAIDNLVKGAAGQAVQNLNLILGLPETTGLQGLRAFHP